MTCKDCIHYDICDDFLFAVKKDIKTCDDFKDKSKYIELPCKVGDVVYCIQDNKIKPCIVLNYYYDFFGLMCDLKISQNDCSPNELTSINKISQFTKCDVFLTKEEAEAKLKELSK